MTRSSPAILALLLLPATGAGQLMIGTEVSVQNDFVWRGLTRANPPSFQPSIVVGYKSAMSVVAAGAWASLEPFDPGAEDVSNVGTGGDVLGEADYWVQWDWRLQQAVALDVALGWTAYTFHGRSSLSGRGSEWNTNEVYTRVRVSRAQAPPAVVRMQHKARLALETAAWKDLGPIGGVYGEIALEADLPLLPLGEPMGALLVRGTLGLSYDQRHVPGTTLRHYDGDGPTHFDLSAGSVLSFPLPASRLTVYPTGHLQVGIDPATLRRGLAPGDRSRVFVWWGLTASVLFPMRRVP